MVSPSSLSAPTPGPTPATQIKNNKMKRIIGAVAVAALLATSACKTDQGNENEPSDFVRVENGEFMIGDSSYRYIGTNFWYGAILASEGVGGDRQRLAAELDTLSALGIDNLRILVGGDGEEGLPSHISPTLQKQPGEYNDTLLRGLDYLLAELEKRDMKAVLYLNNAWEWSGGFSTYLEWAGAGKAVNPATDGYPAYMDYASQFVINDSAMKLADNHIRNIVGRVNTVTGKPYSESPAIMSWQIANEPRAFKPENKEALRQWIARSAKSIKEIDPNHLVSVGSEGLWGCENDLDLWTRIHQDPNIDYGTIHIWPYNWSWVSPETLTDSLHVAKRNASDYIRMHRESLDNALGEGNSKPIVLEEFGYPRDNMAYALGSPVSGRDGFYSHVFDEVVSGGALNGVNFWGWGGLAIPNHDTWQPGDPYTGDPAQEAQGLNSVFASDTTTIAIIKNTVIAIK